MNVTNSTKFVIEITPSDVVIFTVNAVNVLGNGRMSSITSELINIRFHYEFKYSFSL